MSTGVVTPLPRVATSDSIIADVAIPAGVSSIFSLQVLFLIFI